jgi:hypothetical protein
MDKQNIVRNFNNGSVDEDFSVANFRVLLKTPCRHAELDSASPAKMQLTRGLRVKPAMTEM